MKLLFSLLILASLGSCTAQIKNTETEVKTPQKTEQIPSEVEQHFMENDTVTAPSLSKGTVSNGKLENGRIVPFSGPNFHYFDTTSYLANRGFTNEKVLNTILQAYEALETSLPNRHFCLMECSHQHGGKLYPHRTHQNGLSVDFMMPKRKDDQPYYELDGLGAQHYMLKFDENGRYSEDPSVQLDFDAIALHILELQSAATQNGLSIEKVIINTSLKDELFATEHGKQLKTSGIYVVRNLTPLINALHDDHFHIDFRLE